MTKKIIIWFRQDLRLADHPALHFASEQGAEIIPLYILEDGIRPWGGASRWWLHHSLASLSQSLGNKLILRRGPALKVLQDVINESGATAIYWSRRYDPLGISIDTTAKAALKNIGMEVQSFNSSLLYEPWDLKPYRVFTPFWKACRLLNTLSSVLPAPQLKFAGAIPSDPLASWSLLPTLPDWSHGLQKAWAPGEDAAHDQLHSFLAEKIRGYAESRNRPDLANTSRLSPYLHWGEISPRQVWFAACAQAAGEGALGADLDRFLAELGWREFSHHLLYHFPHMVDAPLDPKFSEFPWASDANFLEAWQQGRTGFPLVDAGMKELWATGWMHNRVRMIAASFLIKDLFIHWKEGEAWFWDTLVDADMANNIVSWQWVAGCGADAAPYFRVFNPTLQAEKFDPHGKYVKQWAPQSRNPIVDHASARLKALEIWKQLKRPS